MRLGRGTALLWPLLVSEDLRQLVLRSRDSRICLDAFAQRQGPRRLYGDSIARRLRTRLTALTLRKARDPQTETRVSRQQGAIYSRRTTPNPIDAYSRLVGKMAPMTWSEGTRSPAQGPPGVRHYVRDERRPQGLVEPTQSQARPSQALRHRGQLSKAHQVLE